MGKKNWLVYIGIFCLVASVSHANESTEPSPEDIDSVEDVKLNHTSFMNLLEENEPRTPGFDLGVGLNHSVTTYKHNSGEMIMGPFFGFMAEHHIDFNGLVGLDSELHLNTGLYAYNDPVDYAERLKRANILRLKVGPRATFQAVNHGRHQVDVTGRINLGHFFHSNIKEIMAYTPLHLTYATLSLPIAYRALGIGELALTPSLIQGFARGALGTEFAVRATSDFLENLNIFLEASYSEINLDRKESRSLLRQADFTLGLTYNFI